MSSIGDVLLASPLIRILQKNIPDCSIDFVIKERFKELVAYHPGISKIHVYDRGRSLRAIRQQIRAERYDTIIDIHKNFRSIYLRTGVGADHIATFKKYAIRRWLLVHWKLNFYKTIVPVYQRYLNSMHLTYDGAGLDLYIPDDVKEKVASNWSMLRGEPIVGIAPGASFMTKRWLTEGFIEVIRHLTDQLNATVILFGNEDDRTLTSEIAGSVRGRVHDAAGRLSLLECAALIERCSLVITNDSGLMHMATAMKKKVVAIFGSTTEELGFFPLPGSSMIVQHAGLRCRPCSHIGRHRCPEKHFKCMKEIAPERVIEAVHRLFSGEKIVQQ